MAARPREPCIPSPPPPAIGHTMGCDFAVVKDSDGMTQKFLIVTDYLTNWCTYIHFQKEEVLDEKG